MKIPPSEYNNIKNLYINELKTLEEIASIYNLKDYRIIQRILVKKLKISTRTGKYAQVHSIKDKLNISIIKHMYFDNMMSLEQIAKYFSCDAETIRMFMKENNISLRNKATNFKNLVGARLILKNGTEYEKNILKDKMSKSKYKIDVNDIDNILKERKIERLEPYFRNDKKIKFKCLITGIIWSEYVCKVLNSKTIGGPFKRKQQTLTNIFLQELLPNVDIEREKTILIGNKKLKVDFYFHIKNKVIIVEYNGIQHYKPVRFNGIDMNRAEHNLIKQQFRDNILKEYCVKNDIILIEIDGRYYENRDIFTFLKYYFTEKEII